MHGDGGNTYRFDCVAPPCHRRRVPREASVVIVVEILRVLLVYLDSMYLNSPVDTVSRYAYIVKVFLVFHLTQTTRERSVYTSGPIPDELSQLEELSQLFLADNELDGTYAERLSLLTS